VILPPEARSAWLSEARDVLTERQSERHSQRVAHARGQLTLPGSDISGLRRRRDASLRCEPLPDGRRDVLSRPKPTAAPTLRVEVGRRTAWLYGDDIVGLLERARVDRRQWDWQRRVWMIPIDRADDVISYAEWRQRRIVTVEDVDR
jgi:hypothetical protein